MTRKEAKKIKVGDELYCVEDFVEIKVGLCKVHKKLSKFIKLSKGNFIFDVYYSDVFFTEEEAKKYALPKQLKHYEWLLDWEIQKHEKLSNNIENMIKEYTKNVKNEQRSMARKISKIRKNISKNKQESEKLSCIRI